MADNDQPSRLEAATIKAEAGSDIVYRVANLPADQTVATDSGNIPTLAGVLYYVQNEGYAAAADVRAKADAQVQAAIGTLVKKAGDSMTGLLILSGDPSSSLGAAPKRYVDTGDANTLASAKAYTDARPSAIGKYFESTPQDLTASSVLTIGHSIGSVPIFVTCHAICQASTQGYAAGDFVEFPVVSLFSGANAVGLTVEKTSTQLLVRIPASVASTPLVSKATAGGTVNFNPITNWKFIFRAYGR